MEVPCHRGDPYRPTASDRPHHIDALWSLVLHVVVLGAAYYAFSHRPATADTERRVAATRQAAASTAAVRGLENLQEIERTLAASAGTPAPPPEAAAATPQEALRQARKHYDAIRKAEHDIHARDLATLLDIPLEDALRQTASEMPPLPPSPTNDEAAVAQLEQLQERARQTLVRRGDYLRRRDSQRVALGGDGQGRGGGSDPSASASVDEALARFDVLMEPPRRAALSASGRPAPVPSVDPGLVIAGTGRRIGPGGVFVNRLYVDTWYVLGPFEAPEGHPLAQRLPPESAIDLDGAYEGKRGRTLTWQYLHASEYPTYLPDPAENAVYYGYTELMLDREQEVWAWIGADDDCKVWVNDRLVWGGGAPIKPWFLVDARSMKREIAEYNLSEGKVRLRLRQGRNRILFKLHNGIEVMFFSLVLTNAEADAAAGGASGPPSVTR